MGSLRSAIKGSQAALPTFSVAIAIGAFHEAEHVVQVVQRYALDVPNGNGVLGSVADIKPLHFAYNAAYLAALVWVATTIGPFASGDRASWRLLQFALALQLWHVFEHYLKLAQYFAYGLQNGTGGFFGAGPGGLLPLAPVPLLHFAYNTLVFAPLLVVYARFARARA